MPGVPSSAFPVWHQRQASGLSGWEAVNVIANALANSGLPTERLELEVTFRPLPCSFSCARSLSVSPWMNWYGLVRGILGSAIRSAFRSTRLRLIVRSERDCREWTFDRHYACRCCAGAGVGDAGNQWVSRPNN